jgi:hypothetical protein
MAAKYDKDVINALAFLRAYMKIDAHRQVQRAFDTLDNAGVFAALDEQTGYDVTEIDDETIVRYSAAHAQSAIDELDASDRAAMGRLARKALGLD